MKELENTKNRKTFKGELEQLYEMILDEMYIYQH